MPNFSCASLAASTIDPQAANTVTTVGSIAAVGGNATIRADVRIVAATNRNLEQAIASKEFREDLYYRLNVVGIHLPPLRARIEDVRLLAEYFLSRIANQQHRPQLQLSEETIRVMEA